MTTNHEGNYLVLGPTYNASVMTDDQGPTSN